jgi:2,3-bisphosphoglycerate-dependent phosphoglycerate mutase
MAKTRIILTRHGETDWNAGERIQGHTDVELNAAGSAQAAALAERLAGEPIDVIYSSDLSRAERTAAAVRDRHPNAEFIRTVELRERNWGALEGLRWSEIIESHPADAATLKTGAADYAPEGGESKNQLRERVESFLDSMVAEHAGKTILVVTHGGVSAMIVRCVLGIDLVRRIPFRVDNCSVTEIECGDSGRIVKMLNCTCHIVKTGRRVSGDG